MDEVYKIRTRNDVCEIELKRVMNHRECHIVRNKEGKIKIVDLEKYDIKITDKRGRSIVGSVIGNFDEDKLRSNDKRYMDAVCVDYFDDGMRLLKCMTDYGGYLGELEKDEIGKYRVTRIEEVKNKYKGKNSITDTRYEEERKEEQEQSIEQIESKVRRRYNPVEPEEEVVQRRRYNPEKPKEEPVRRRYNPEKPKEEPVRRRYNPEKPKEEPVRRRRYNPEKPKEEVIQRRRYIPENEREEYVPKHLEKGQQEYIPRHTKKEEQEYIPRHAKKEEQEYVPRHAKKEEQEYVPRHAKKEIEKVRRRYNPKHSNEDEEKEI